MLSRSRDALRNFNLVDEKRSQTNVLEETSNQSEKPITLLRALTEKTVMNDFHASKSGQRRAYYSYQIYITSDSYKSNSCSHFS